MPRSHEELARFRGNDLAYCEGWESVFGKNKKKDYFDCGITNCLGCPECMGIIWEKEQNEEPKNVTTDNTSGGELRHSDKDDDRICSEHASHGQDVLRENDCGSGVP